MRQSLASGFGSKCTAVRLAHAGPTLVAASTDGAVRGWNLGLPESYLGSIYSAQYLPAQGSGPGSVVPAGEVPYRNDGTGQAVSM